ncbi:MAG: hypothetical protein M1831_007594 [Alyxoria varia]|nr:MAG: hypothetical protein M1831_007594 [Alyxoria varia]
MAESSRTQTSAHKILARAHSPSSTSRIYEDKVHYKPLRLLPTTSNTNAKDASNQLDARQLRQQRRRAQVNARSRKSKSKPKPLSAKEKRKLGVHDIPKREAKYEIYKGLHQLWRGYIRDVLGLEGAGEGSKRRQYVSASDAGPKILSADFHGAELEVVRSRCVGRVGVKGLVVRDTKFTFTVITKEDALKSMSRRFNTTSHPDQSGMANWFPAIPKEHTVFRLEVPLRDGHCSEGKEDGVASTGHALSEKTFVFELQGSQIENRGFERANKKFKMRIPEDL